MVHAVVIYCQNLDMDLNTYENIFMHPEAQLLCYNCHLCYIFNYAL